ncbi:MAG: hypothetical protein ABMB14_14020, partial [Myxococcota bacterium]
GPAVRGGRRAGEKLGPQVRARLMEAHQLKQSGQYALAAAKFTEMAQIARERGRSRIATTLWAQAAQCHAKAGNQQGLTEATQSAIAEAQLEADTDHSSRAFGELLGSLQGTAFAGATPQLEGAIRTAIGVAPVASTAPVGEVNRSLRRNLPSECEGCGAPVSSAEVKFNASGNADCPYCGSILTA